MAGMSSNNQIRAVLTVLIQENVKSNKTNANSYKSIFYCTFLRGCAGPYIRAVSCRSVLGGQKNLVIVRGGNGFLCYAFKPKTSADVRGAQGCQQVTQSPGREAFPEKLYCAETFTNKGCKV